MEDSHVTEFKAIRMRGGEGRERKRALGAERKVIRMALGVRTLDTEFNAIYMALVVVVGGGGCHGQRSRPSTWPGGPD